MVYHLRMCYLGSYELLPLENRYIRHILFKIFTFKGVNFPFFKYSVFLWTFLTTSCGRNFDDIDLRFFANCRRRRFFCDVPHMVIYLLLFAIRDDPINSYQDIIVHVKVKGHQYAIIL